MERIRDWLRRLTGQTRSNAARPQRSDGAARQTRADRIVALQADVSRLQQEILALSNAAVGGPGGAARGASSAQMAQLEQRLEATQEELAKYQGRI